MKVLIPVDGSDCARDMLKWAAETLDKRITHYHLVSVVTDPMIAEYEIRDSNRHLTQARELLEAHGCHVKSAVYIQGDDPAESICDYAEELNVDQVLMGSHGRSGMAKALLGSVSVRVLQRCSKPVFIYRNPQRKAS